MKVQKNSVNLDVIKQWLGNGSINVFGLPFSGKDTHGHSLAKVLDGQLIGGGEIIRSVSAPQHMKDHIATGELTPTNEYLDLVLPYLFQPKYANQPLVLSSVGRWHGEESSVVEAADRSGHPIKAVIYLKIDPTEARRRHDLSVKSGDRGLRGEDAIDVLDKRFDEFKQKTLPVIEYYRHKGLLIEIDGKPPISSVSQAILNQLSMKAQS
ncbi:MAG TPA: nucleoside monophosphate kinase [Candidatus Saccharimonadales bacterium]|nr:nucleoside monophosphate kinase [Candidatus Saccharimonadales bacterium]